MTGFRRFTQEIALTVGFVFLVFWLVSMLTHQTQDPAWTTSGALNKTLNWGGKIGAWLSDMSFFLFGYSIVWCYLAGGVVLGGGSFGQAAHRARERVQGGSGKSHGPPLA